MKSYVRLLLAAGCLASLTIVTTPALSAADSAPAKPPTLAQLIGNPKFLQSTLSVKALIVVDARTGDVPDDVKAAIKAAELDERTQFINLPKNSTQPDPKHRVAPEYPYELRRRGISGSAKYLFMIGSDGAIKGIYCYEASHRELALAGAQALVKWKFTPAKLEGTAVPVMAYQTLDFSAN
jgi:outer membrane biosynthesis protein TonB